MIKINLIKKEKRKVSLPSLSLKGVKEAGAPKFGKETALILVPIVGVAAVAIELLYAFKIKQEITSLRQEVSNLTTQRNKLKKKADEIQAKKRALQNEINLLKNKIKQIEMSKDIIVVLKDYYIPFNQSLDYLYTYTPSTVWLNSLSQNMTFENVNIELSFGSYDINSIKNFYTIIKKEFPQLSPNEIKKQENKSGIIYYVSSVKVRKNFSGEGE